MQAVVMKGLVKALEIVVVAVCAALAVLLLARPWLIDDLM